VTAFKAPTPHVRTTDREEALRLRERILMLDAPFVIFVSVYTDPRLLTDPLRFVVFLGVIEDAPEDRAVEDAIGRLVEEEWPEATCSVQVRRGVAR